MKCTVLNGALLAVLMLVSATLLEAAKESPRMLRLRMKGVKRDASHIANYYLPASMSGGGGHHQQVLDVKLPQSAGGHYIPHYAIPSKSYESTAHHFQVASPQFSHSGQQYVLSGVHGGQFEELSKVLGSQGSSANGYQSFAQLGGVQQGSYASQYGSGSAAGGQGGHSLVLAPQSQGSQGYSLGGGSGSSGGNTAFLLASKGISFGGQAAGQNTKTGPVSFVGAVSQQAPPQQSAYPAHQFGFVNNNQQQQQSLGGGSLGGGSLGGGSLGGLSFGHGFGGAQAAALTAGNQIPKTMISTPVYAAGIKGLGHYGGGSGGKLGGSSFFNFGGGHSPAFSSLGGHSLGGGGQSFGGHSLGGGSQSFGGHSLGSGGQSFGGLSLGGGSQSFGGHSLGGGQSYGGGHSFGAGQSFGGAGISSYGGGHSFGSGGLSSASFGGEHSFGGSGSSGISSFSGDNGYKYYGAPASSGFQFGGQKYVIMSKPQALGFEQSQGKSILGGAQLATIYSGPKSNAPFKPSVFLGATQESIGDYEQHGQQQQQQQFGGQSIGGASGQEYKLDGPTVASLVSGSGGGGVQYEYQTGGEGGSTGAGSSDSTGHHH